MGDQGAREGMEALENILNTDVLCGDSPGEGLGHVWGVYPLRYKLI